MLNSAQLATFKAAIVADPNIAAELAALDDAAIAAYYNAPSSPAVSLWRPNIPVAELNTAVDWSAFAGLTALKQNTYFAMTQPGFVDATAVNIRNGFGTVFGTSTTLTALTALAQRTATRFEALFTTANVCALFGIVVNAEDVRQARNS